MAYHITVITNNSSKSIAITNPAHEADSMLLGPGATYKPSRPILVNKIGGNPTYEQALSKAVNIYTLTDNYCFWDNENSAVNGIGESGGTIVFNASAGDLQIAVNTNGTLSFSRVGASAAAM